MGFGFVAEGRLVDWDLGCLDENANHIDTSFPPF